MVDFLSKVFLFKGVAREEIEKVLSTVSPIKCDYGRKEEIYSPTSYERKLGFIMSGECRVDRLRHDGSSVPLNILKSGDSFGAISVFTSEEEYPTKITATKDTAVLYLTAADIETLIVAYPKISLNVIRFLSEKIIFLNKKIATFSEDSVESKLASYLYESYTKFGAEFPFNCKRSAESISVGRASLYRAVASLTDSGIIKLENKKIIIIDPKGLERKTK